MDICDEFSTEMKDAFEPTAAEMRNVIYVMENPVPPIFYLSFSLKYLENGEKYNSFFEDVCLNFQ